MENGNNKTAFNIDLENLGAPPNTFTAFSVHKYARYVWQYKYWVLLSGIILAIGWGNFYPIFKKHFIKYTTSTKIRFDNPERISAVQEFDIVEIEGKIAILTTKSFLNQVVDSLHLNLMVHSDSIDQMDFIKAVQDHANPPGGTYRLLTQGGFVDVYPKDSDSLIFNSQIAEADSATRIDIGSLSLIVATKTLQAFNRIEVSYIPRRSAVTNLKNQIQHYLNRSQTILNISFTHKDPQMSATTTNTIARLFLRQLLEYKRLQTGSVLKSLKDQLNVAQKELEISRSALRKFREINPRVYLSGEGERAVNQLSFEREHQQQLTASLEQLGILLQKKLQSTHFKDQKYLYQEILDWLGQNNVSGVANLRQEYLIATTELQQLKTDHVSSQFARMTALQQQVKELQYRIDFLINDYSTQIRNKLSQNRAAITVAESNLKGLPEKQLQLAELERTRQIKENIVANILLKYNEAKVADAAIFPDAYIIDEAEAPLVHARSFQEKVNIYAVGLFLGCCLSIGVIVLFAFFDNTIKNIEDVQHQLSLPVLATIPVIDKSTLNNPEQIELVSPNCYDPKLITANYLPTIAGEAFRRLRSKLTLRDPGDRQTFLITSAEPGEGKSLIAANLAITIAQQNINTLLLDCDLRRGVLHASFHCPRTPGIAEFISNDYSIDDANTERLILGTHIPNLSLITCGDYIPNPAEILAGNRMKMFLEHLSKKFSVIIIDSPPFRITPDIFSLTPLADQMILVTRFGKTHLGRLRKSMLEFMEMNTGFRGVVINASEETQPKNHYYSYYNY